MIKHYYYFGERTGLSGNALSAQNWDTLRLNGDMNFALEEKGEWERKCLNNEFYRKKAEKVVESVDNELRNWISFGIGKGILERNIVDIDSTISISGTDYARETVDILIDYFAERAEVFCFDLLNYDEYDKLNEYEVAVMGRISTEFRMEQWIRIFKELFKTTIKEIVFIPTEILSFCIAVRELFNHWSHILLGKNDIMCGYMYTKREFERMFGPWRIRRFYDDDAMWVLCRE